MTFFLLLETCRCPKILTTAWENLAPLVQMNGSLSGIMPKFVTEAVSSCCGNCSLGQGPSSIDWGHDALNRSSIKSSKEALLDAIMAETHVTLPFFKDTITMEGSSSTPYDFIPFLQSPGMAFFKRKPSKREVGNKSANNLIESVFTLYSVVIVMVVFIVAAGCIFWILVSIE